MGLDPREDHKPESVCWGNQQFPPQPSMLVIEAKHLDSELYVLGSYAPIGAVRTMYYNMSLVIDLIRILLCN